jgi:Protein of unknown function (DUF2752)
VPRDYRWRPVDPAITSEPWHAERAGDAATSAARRPWARLGGLAAVAGVTAYVGLVDPSRGGAYVVCPSQLFLGVDCPACGGLRGTHDLLHGDVGAALDHNVLLPVWLGLYAALLGLWLVPLLGRAAPAVRPPRWLVVGGIVLAVGFTVLRNLPVAGLEFLASDA